MVKSLLEVISMSIVQAPVDEGGGAVLVIVDVGAVVTMNGEGGETG